LANLPVPTLAPESPGNYITSALWAANVYNSQTFLLNPPMWEVWQSVGQGNVATSTAVQITFTSVTTDSYSAYSTATSTYTVPLAGWYWINSSVHWASNTAGIRYTRIYQNGIGTSTMASTSGGSGVVSASIGGPVLCAAGDTLQIWGYQSSGGALAPQSGGGFTSWFAGYWMHA